MTRSDALDPAVVESLRQLTPPGEPDVLREVLQLFLAEMPKRVERLTRACQERNAFELQRAAHSLKGSTGNIGARHAHEICRQLDERGKAGDVDGALRLLDALDHELVRVEAEIRGLLG